MSKITIDLEDLKKYISTLDGNHDEWWMTEYDLYTTGIIRFFETVDEGFASKIKIAVQDHSVKYDTRGIPIGEAPTKTEGQGYEY